MPQPTSFPLRGTREGFGAQLGSKVSEGVKRCQPLLFPEEGPLFAEEVALTRGKGDLLQGLTLGSHLRPHFCQGEWLLRSVRDLTEGKVPVQKFLCGNYWKRCQVR